jgi:hypothetical protein
MMSLRAAMIVGLSLMPLAGAAGAVDVNKPLICAALQLTSCVPGDGCRAETTDSLNAPRFLNIDLGAKSVTGTRPQSSELRTAIHNVRARDEDVVLDGSEAELTWNIAIDKSSGDMTLTGIRTAHDEAIVIVVFGACTNR